MALSFVVIGIYFSFIAALSKGYGNDTILNYLNYQACVEGNTGQQFKYDNSTKLIQLLTLVDNKQLCAFATGSSWPVGMTPCNPSDTSQQWTYINKFFKSTLNSCLDVYEQQGPEVDEYTCKSPNDPQVANQNWMINETQIISDVTTFGYFCLTSVPYQ